MASSMEQHNFSPEQLPIGADVCLVFESQEGEDNTLHAHAAILALHSKVLASALDINTLRNKSTGVNHGSSGSDYTVLRKLPMPGTTRTDFMVLAPFLYPTTPLPKVSWENVEVLLVEGRKWDMQVVLPHASDFLVANAGCLVAETTSPKCAFKWLKLADAASLTDACKACINKIVQLSPSTPWPAAASGSTIDAAATNATNATEQRWLELLSPKTLVELVESLARRQSSSPSTTQMRCNGCYATRTFTSLCVNRCSHCGREQ